MKKQKITPERIRLLSTSRGFEAVYFSHLPQCDTQREAYERTEEEHVSIFHRTRYSGYQSFLRVIYRRHKRK